MDKVDALPMIHQATPPGPQPKDRRRPGRRENIDPALVDLLRGNHTPTQPPELITFEEADQLGAMRGVATGAAIVTAPLFLVLLTLWLLR